MLNTDLERPINALEEDRMNLRPFADGLARALLADDFSTARGVKVGLEGSWGSGKSSLLNLVEERLKDHTNDKIYLMRFDPWLVSGRNDLIVVFLRNLAETINPNSQKKTLISNVASSIIKYSILLSPAFDTVAPSLGGAVSNTLEELSKKTGSEPSLTKMRKDVETALGKLDRPLVIMIDELDRVEDAEVRTIAQLVRSVLDFPRISYLLAYDPKRVAQALGDGDEDRGTAYLEKIIQLRVPLPAQTPKALRQILREDFQDMVSANTDAPLTAWDRFPGLLDAAIPSLIKTIRDLRRTLATFTVLEPMLRYEVDLIDLLGWSILITNAPEVIRSLSTHLSEICGPALLVGNELLLSYLDSYSDWRLVSSQLPDDIVDKDRELLEYLLINDQSNSQFINTLRMKDTFLTVLTQGCHTPRIPVAEVIQAAHGGYENFRNLAVRAWNNDSLPQFLGALRIGYNLIKIEDRTKIFDWLIQLAEDDEVFGTMLGTGRRHRWLAIGFIIVSQYRIPLYLHALCSRLYKGLSAGHSVLISHIVYLARERFATNYDKAVPRDWLGDFNSKEHLDDLAEDLTDWADKLADTGTLVCSLRDSSQFQALLLAGGSDYSHFRDKIWKELINNEEAMKHFFYLIYKDECSVTIKEKEEITCNIIRGIATGNSEDRLGEFYSLLYNLGQHYRSC